MMKLHIHSLKHHSRALSKMGAAKRGSGVALVLEDIVITFRVSSRESVLGSLAAGIDNLDWIATTPPADN